MRVNVHGGRERKGKTNRRALTEVVAEGRAGGGGGGDARLLFAAKVGHCGCCWLVLCVRMGVRECACACALDPRGRR